MGFPLVEVDEEIFGQLKSNCNEMVQGIKNLVMQFLMRESQRPWSNRGLDGRSDLGKSFNLFQMFLQESRERLCDMSIIGYCSHKYLNTQMTC